MRIDNATTTTYSGIINSFAAGDVLELGNTDATSATPTFNGTNTILTVDLTSGGPLTYSLAGNLSGDTFGVTENGENADIAISSGSAFAQAALLLGDPAATSFAGSNGVFGASNTVDAPGGAQFESGESIHAYS